MRHAQRKEEAKIYEGFCQAKKRGMLILKER